MPMQLQVTRLLKHKPNSYKTKPEQTKWCLPSNTYKTKICLSGKMTGKRKSTLTEDKRKHIYWGIRIFLTVKELAWGWLLSFCCVSVRLLVGSLGQNSEFSKDITVQHYGEFSGFETYQITRLINCCYNIFEKPNTHCCYVFFSEFQA